MARVRVLLVWCIVLCGLVVHPAPVQGAPDNPYWRTNSNLPVETITGEWSETKGGTAVELTFSGHNVVGQRSSFVAGWVTPWMTPNSEISASGEIDLLETPVTSVDVAEMVRLRFKGTGWSPWFRNRLPLSDGSLSFGGNLQWAGSGSVPSVSPKVQFEWRWVGEIDGLAKIEGSVRIKVE